MTVHDDAGNNAMADGYWFERDWTAPLLSTRNQQYINSNQFQKSLAKIFNSISSSKWKENCIDALWSYNRAFSLPDMEQSFLQGWRCFEYLLGAENKSLDNVLNRVIFHYKEPEYVRQLLNHLRLRRNSIVHGRKMELHDDETLVFQLNSVIVHILFRYILNEFKFKRLEELYEFWDQEVDLEKRRKISRLLEMVDSYQKK